MKKLLIGALLFGCTLGATLDPLFQALDNPAIASVVESTRQQLQKGLTKPEYENVKANLLKNADIRRLIEQYKLDTSYESYLVYKQMGLLNDLGSIENIKAKVKEATSQLDGTPMGSDSRKELRRWLMKSLTEKTPK